MIGLGDGRGQSTGLAGVQFCARLNAFKDLSSLFCNSIRHRPQADPRLVFWEIRWDFG
jgi:hypothetical protein